MDHLPARKDPLTSLLYDGEKICLEIQTAKRQRINSRLTKYYVRVRLHYLLDPAVSMCQMGLSGVQHAPAIE